MERGQLDMSTRLRLPIGRIEGYRKSLDRKLQTIRKRVAQKQMSKAAAKEQGTLVIRSHYRGLIAFVSSYLKHKKRPQRFNIGDFEADMKEATESWEKIVDDM